MSDSGDFNDSNYIVYQGDDEDGAGYTYYEVTEQNQENETIVDTQIEPAKELIIDASNDDIDDDVVEYLDEYQDVNDETEVFLDENNSHDENANTNDVIYHTLIEKQSQNDLNGKMTFHCLQCNCEYLSIAEFSDAHKAGNQPKLDQMKDEKTLENYEMSEQNWVIVDDNEQSLLQESLDESYKKVPENSTHNIVQENFDLNDISEDDTCFVDEEEFIKIETPSKQQSNQKSTVVEKDTKGEELDFFCSNCFVLFENQEMLSNHECITNSANIKYLKEQEFSLICEHCGKMFKTSVTLQRHQDKCLESAQKSVFTCRTCGKCFQSVKALNSHGRMHKTKISTVKPENAVKCNICNTEFSSERGLKLHEKMHFRRKSRSIVDALPPGAKIDTESADHFFCEICNKSFDRNLLDIHRNMHRNVEEYVCSTCNHHFENLPSYEVHLQMHAEKNNARTFPIRKIKSEGKRVFPCQYCGHEFPRPHEKVKHERVHTGEKPYKCEVCGKCFRVAYSLTLHLRSHTDVRPYACALCNKRFKSHSVYTHHLRTHQLDRPYKCDVCPKAFRTSVQLFGHKNSHNKPFNCLECSRPFASLHDVKKHMKTHVKSNKANENLKYRCGFCGAVYARVFALRLHIKEHHRINATDGAVQFEHLGILTEEQSDDGEEGEQMIISETIETNEMNDEVEITETEAAIQQLTDNCLDNDLNVIDMVEQVVEEEADDASALIESDGDEISEIVVDNVEIIDWDNN